MGTTHLQSFRWRIRYDDTRDQARGHRFHSDVSADESHGVELLDGTIKARMVDLPLAAKGGVRVDPKALSRLGNWNVCRVAYIRAFHDFTRPDSDIPPGFTPRHHHGLEWADEFAQIERPSGTGTITGNLRAGRLSRSAPRQRRCAAGA